MPDENLPSGDSPALTTEASNGVETPSIKNSITLAVTVFAFALVLLLVSLTFVGLKGRSQRSSATADEIASLRAEADALLDAQNRNRATLEQAPTQEPTDSLEDITTRLQRDMDALVALAGTYQKMIRQEAAGISSRESELVRSEETCQSLRAEIARLQAELDRSVANSTDSTRLARDLTDMQAHRDALASELAATRQQLQATAAAVPAEDHADLKRRFDETQRAKEFFEARVKELENNPSKGK